MSVPLWAAVPLFVLAFIGTYVGVCITFVLLMIALEKWEERKHLRRWLAEQRANETATPSPGEDVSPSLSANDTKESE